MKKLFKNKKRIKKIILISLMMIFVLGIIGLMPGVQAAGEATVTIPDDGSHDMPKAMVTLLSYIVLPLVSVAGKLLLMLVEILVPLASYNDFIDSRAVAIGWVVVRDLSNLFFVIVMLVIAFGTLFNIQTYEYKKLLPKLIIAAILVNFSKMIVGIFIDIGQVIMLTFVDAFKGLAAGAVVGGFGLNNMLELSNTVTENSEVKITNYSIFGALVLALIMLVVAIVVILTLVIVLLFRAVMLWVLIIFAPLAFVASLLPTSPLQKIGFFGQYWNYLSKYIIVGPVLAFFLWLSFGIMTTINQQQEESVIKLRRDLAANTKLDVEMATYFASKVSGPQLVFDYMTTVALLIGSLVITQQIGVMGGSVGMSMVNKMRSKAGSLARGIGRAGMGTALWVAKRPWAFSKYADRKLAAAKGFAPITSTKKFIQGIKERGEWAKQRDELMAQSKGGDILRKPGGGPWSVIGGIGAGRDWADVHAAGGFMNRRGFTNMWNRGIKGQEWEKIQEKVDEEKEGVAFLQLKKERGDPLAAYTKKYETMKQENIEERDKKGAELKALPELDKEAEKKWLKAAKDYGQDSPQAEEARKKHEALVNEVIPERKKVLLNDIIDHNKNIKQANEALTGDEEELRQKAINEYMKEAQEKKDEAKNLREGKLGKDERKDNNTDLRRMEGILQQIDKDIKKKEKDPSQQYLVTQLKEDRKKNVDKMDELKKVMHKDYRVKDEKKLEANKKKADDLETEAKNDEGFATEAKERWAAGKEAVNIQAVDRLINKKLGGVKKLEEEQVKYQAPQAFYADQARRALVAEEEKKITSDNWEEQLAAMRDALATKDRFKFEANFKAAAKRGNENEIMDQLGFLNAYRGPEDDVTPAPWKGQGVEAFRKHYLVDKLGMNEQDSMGVMDDVGYIGEGVGHWSVARGYGIKGGRRYAKKWDEQQNEVYAEQSKLDGRRLFRTFNRLGWGGEIPQLDGKRKFQLEPYAIKRIITSFTDMAGHIPNKEFNKSYAESLAQSNISQEQLKAVVKMIPEKMRPEFDQFVADINKYGAKKEAGGSDLKAADIIDRMTFL